MLVVSDSPPPHILVVDDDAPFRGMMQQAMVRFGYICQTAEDGSRALDIIALHQAIDLVITDIRMPDMDGIELLKAVQRKADSDVIVMTGFVEEYTYADIIENGAKDFIQKPVSVKELIYRIKRVLKERELLKEQQRTYLKLKSLTHELAMSQENERLRISRDLHDGVAQDLSVLKLTCETFVSQQDGVGFSVRRKVSEMTRMLQHSIDSVREIAQNLRPPMFQQVGLIGILYGLSQEFSKQNDISVDFYSAGIDGIDFEEDTDTHLYRIVQESLHNIRRHADATSVVIRIVASFPDILLRIEDNGAGFEVETRVPRAQEEHRFGLKGMSERVSLMGGDLRIESQTGMGTRIVVRVPILQKSSKVQNL